MSTAEPVRATNGAGSGAGGAGDSSDDEGTAPRPVNIEQDMHEMDRRKRVEVIMGSKLFKEELEKVVSESMANEAGAGAGAGGLDGISQMISQINLKGGVSGGMKGSSLGGGAPLTITPINDIRGLAGMAYTKLEKHLRCKLASAYRLLHLFGWSSSHSLHNHVTLRISQDTEHFLINPYGMLFGEVTASNLLKVNMQGQLVEEELEEKDKAEGDESAESADDKAAAVAGPGDCDVEGFGLHAAIHAVRPDLKCILHLQTPNIVAVSAMKCGLLSLCQEACLFGDVSYHNYNGLGVDPGERETIFKDLFVHNKVMVLRNHGVLCCGETIEEAFFYACNFSMACDTQVKMLPLGLDNLVTIDDEKRKKVYEQLLLGELNNQVDQASKDCKADKKDKAGRRKRPRWNVGEMEFEALMRTLDNAGYRTGYPFRLPLSKDEPSKPKSDVELPPSVSSLGYLLEEENLSKDGPLRALLSDYAKSATKGLSRTKWTNSPNVYNKVEVLETGTSDPKKITKWVADGNSTKSTSIKVDNPNQYVPLGTSKKEFKKLQKAMKEGRRIGGITSGPESKILDEASWEDRVVDGYCTPFGGGAADHPMDYKFGAASKGIIQRDYQHHATVYGSAYAKNPFDNVSEEELKEYQRIIDHKRRGLDVASPDDDDGVDGGGGGAGDSTCGEITTTGDITCTSPGATAVTSAVLSPTSDTEHDGDGHTLTGEETDGNQTFSEGEGDTSRATEPESTASASGATGTSSAKKDEKKRRSGLKTPSFLKKKKKDKTKKK